jgi:hypothetical protein
MKYPVCRGAPAPDMPDGAARWSPLADAITASLGNLPQAFAHAGVLECAVTLSSDVRLGTAS